MQVTTGCAGPSGAPSRGWRAGALEQMITTSGQDVTVIDAHQHAGVPREASFNVAWAQADIAMRRAQMESAGIDRCVLLPAPGSAGGFRNVDHRAMNDSMAAYGRLAGDLIEGLAATVNPAEVRPACAEMARAFGELGMAAVAFHHRYLGMQVDDSRMHDLLRVAAEYEKTVLIHIVSDSAYEAPWRLLTLARRFPSVRFLALDGFSSALQAQMLRTWAPDFPNVWFDTGAMTSVAHGLAEFIDRCGSERVVLGTDLYSGSPHFRLAFPLLELAAMSLPPQDLARICGGNIRFLLGPPVRAGPASARLRILPCAAINLTSKMLH